MSDLPALTICLNLGGFIIGAVAAGLAAWLLTRRSRREIRHRFEILGEQKRDETELSAGSNAGRGEWRYRALLQASRVMLICLDADDVIVDFDVVSSELTGYALYEVAGKRFADAFLAEEDRSTFESAVGEVRGVGSKKDLELEIRIKGGFRRVVSLVLLAVSDSAAAAGAIMISGRDVTDLRVAERRQLENQRHIRQVFENVPVVLFNYSPRGELVYVSENAERIYGVSPQAIMERNDVWIDFVHPDDQERVRLHWRDSIEKGRDSVLSFRLILAGAETLWVERRCKVVFAQDGRLEAVLGIAIDLTAHREAEKELMESEERYRVLFENANDAIILMGEDIFLDCNKKALELFRCEKGAFVNHPPRDFSPRTQPDGTPTDVKEKNLLAAAWRGESQRFAWRHLRADGEEFDAEVSLTPMSVRGERFLLAILRDVTASRRMELALRQSERRYSEFFNNMQSGVFIYDVAGDGNRFVIRDVNETCERIIGRARSDLVGRDVLEVLPMMRQTSLADTLKRVARTGRMETPPPFAITIDEGERWIDNYVFKLPSGEIVSIFEDITRERATRLEKERLSEQLRQSQKMQAIGQLAGGLAHDFNNLLAGIMNYGEMLEISDSVPGKQRKWANSIVNTARKGADLISQLMSFARNEQNVSVLFDLHDLINQAASILGRTIDRSIRVEKRLNAGKFLVRGDPSELENAIINIALNARDAMPDGGELTFETRNETIDERRRRNMELERCGEHVRLEIADTGRGIPPEIIDKVFEPFFTTKSDGEGTGLGLAGVFGCVKSHGGAIDVQSVFNEGTTLVIHLPVVKRGGDEKRLRTEAEDMVTGEGAVMVVDDEGVVRDGAVAVLEKLGYQAEGLANGEEALSHFQRRHDSIDLVIVDMVMPKMNGLALFRALRGIDPDVQVLIMSGFADRNLMDQVLAEGVAGFVKKPVRMRELSRAVAKAIQNSKEERR